MQHAPKAARSCRQSRQWQESKARRNGRPSAPGVRQGMVSMSGFRSGDDRRRRVAQRCRRIAPGKWSSVKLGNYDGGRALVRYIAEHGNVAAAQAQRNTPMNSPALLATSFAEIDRWAIRLVHTSICEKKTEPSQRKHAATMTRTLISGPIPKVEVPIRKCRSASTP